MMAGMAGPYFKEWRKYRHLTQDQVVDRLASLDDPLIPQTTASLSRLENGKQLYTQRIVEALAEVYQCEPDHLIGRNPEMAGEVIDLWGRLSEQQRRQAMAVIDALQRDIA
jgi:transcriptional regulator with XRE-family HTH domain